MTLLLDVALGVSAVIAAVAWLWLADAHLIRHTTRSKP